MRKLALVLVLAVSTAGCAQLQTAYDVASLATKSVTNPVTKDDLYKIESGVEIAFVALSAYKKSCAQGLVDVNCKSNVAAIQQYTVRVPPLIKQLRTFVRENDQINARIIYNQIVALVANIRSEATARNVTIGG